MYIHIHTCTYTWIFTVWPFYQKTYQKAETLNIWKIQVYLIFSITISINIRIRGTCEKVLFVDRGFHLRWFGKWLVCPFSFGMSPIQTQKGFLEHSWHSFLSPLCNTADGRNFAPPRMCKNPLWNKLPSKWCFGFLPSSLTYPLAPSPRKIMVGRRSFPFGKCWPIFRGKLAMKLPRSISIQKACDDLSWANYYNSQT